jgi:hypothetical protein
MIAEPNDDNRRGLARQSDEGRVGPLRGASIIWATRPRRTGEGWSAPAQLCLGLVLGVAVACSGGERPRQQLASPDGEAAVPQSASPVSSVEPVRERAPSAEPFDAEAESSDQLTVHGEPPAGRVAAYRTALARVRKRVARSRDDFDLVFEPPFVIIGDGGRARVAERADRTVRWAVDRLKKAYFDKDPTIVLEIWLFETAPSYRRNTRAIFGDAPDTPYGTTRRRTRRWS